MIMQAIGNYSLLHLTTLPQDPCRKFHLGVERLECAYTIGFVISTASISPEKGMSTASIAVR